MEYLLALLIVIALIAFVTAPFRRGSDGGEGPEAPEDPRLADLEARKEAKYREIRELEMDRAQGKLSQADFSRADAELRGEAIAILKEIDRTREAVREENARARPARGEGQKG